MGDLLEELEMLVGVVGRHIGELGSGGGVGLGLGLGEDVDVEGDGEVEKERDGGRGGRTMG